MTNHSLLWVPGFLLLLSQWGCVTDNQSREPRMDEATGEVIVTLSNALVFSRPVPNLSTTARDFVYLGPVEVDVMSGQEFFLWVGVASTIDRTSVSEATSKVEEIIIYLDSEPFPFQLTSWPTRATILPYSVRAPVSQSLRTKVTLKQLEQFSESQSIRIALIKESGETKDYAYWSGQWTDWTVLCEQAKFGFAVEVRSK